uniref:Uncharacterized protein n=1 Tax=Anguilla anguilla TaxID=7936 RepID=A0A0E9UFA2_ANGAN
MLLYRATCTAFCIHSINYTAGY